MSASKNHTNAKAAHSTLIQSFAINVVGKALNWFTWTTRREFEFGLRRQEKLN